MKHGFMSELLRSNLNKALAFLTKSGRIQNTDIHTDFKRKEVAVFPTLAWPLWLTGPFVLIADLFVDFLDMIGIKTGLYTVNKTYVKRYGPATAHFIDIGVDVLWMAVLSLAVAVIVFWQPLTGFVKNIGSLNAASAPNVPVIVVPSQTSTLTATPTPTETVAPTSTLTLAPTPTATALNYSFGSSIKAETLQAIMEDLSIQPEDFVVNLTEAKSYPLVAAYGEVISYELSGNGLYVLFVTTGGIIKAKIDYFVIPKTGWSEPPLAISKLTYNQVIMVRDYLNKTIEELDRNPVRFYGIWIGIVGIATESDAENCKNDLASLDNWEQLCFYNSSLGAITSQEMEEKMRGTIVPTTVLDVNSPLPLLSFEGDVKAYIFMEGP